MQKSPSGETGAWLQLLYVLSSSVDWSYPHTVFSPTRHPIRCSVPAQPWPCEVRPSHPFDGRDGTKGRWPRPALVRPRLASRPRTALVSDATLYSWWRNRLDHYPVRGRIRFRACAERFLPQRFAAFASRSSRRPLACESLTKRMWYRRRKRKWGSSWTDCRERAGHAQKSFDGLPIWWKTESSRHREDEWRRLMQCPQLMSIDRTYFVDSHRHLQTAL